MRNASRSPASVRSTAMASLSMVVSTLGLIRFIRQDFGVAVRSNSVYGGGCIRGTDRLKPGSERPQGQKAPLSYRGFAVKGRLRVGEKCLWFAALMEIPYHCKGFAG